MAEKELSILHIDTEKYWRGGQQQAFYLHSGLIHRGIKSFFICNKNSELKKKCEIKNLPFNEVSIFGEIDIIASLKIVRICKRNKIDLIHTHSSHAVSIGLFVKFLYPNVKLICSRRVDFSVNRNFLSKVKYNSRKIDIIICISDFIRNILIKDGLQESKLTTIRSGVDLQKFADIFPDMNFKKNLGIKENDFVLGTVAAFAGHKDYPNLLNALRIVVNKNLNIKVIIVGYGPLENEVKSLIEKLNLKEHIIMTGYQKNVGKYLKTFDLFLLASRKEGLGTSIIDALAVGLPVVATKAGGIPELIENGINGLLVERQNPEKFAEAILTLIEDKPLLNKMSLNAKLSAEKYSIEETIEKNIEVYKNLISRS